MDILKEAVLRRHKRINERIDTPPKKKKVQLDNNDDDEDQDDDSFESG